MQIEEEDSLLGTPALEDFTGHLLGELLSVGVESHLAVWLCDWACDSQAQQQARNKVLQVLLARLKAANGVKADVQRLSREFLETHVIDPHKRTEALRLMQDWIDGRTRG